MHQCYTAFASLGERFQTIRGRGHTTCKYQPELVHPWANGDGGGGEHIYAAVE